MAGLERASLAKMQLPQTAGRTGGANVVLVGGPSKITDEPNSAGLPVKADLVGQACQDQGVTLPVWASDATVRSIERINEANDGIRGNS